MSEAWSDDRLDDLNRRVDTGFAQLHVDIAVQRAEFREDLKEVKQGIKAVDTRLSAKIDTVDTGLREEIKAVDTGLRAKIDTVDTRLGEEIKELGESLNARFDGLQRILIVALLGGLLTIVTERLS